jgi:hypothetical protein
MNCFEFHHRDSLRFGYSCFDRILLNGFIPLLQHPGALATFLRCQRQAPTLTRAYFASLANDYHLWVQRFAQQQDLAILQPPKEARREDLVAPYFQQLAGRPGVAVILQAIEPERIAVSYAKQGHAVGLVRRWVKLYYFYLQDPQCGRMFLRLCPYFPHNLVAWLNGHEWLACQLRREGIAFTQRDNSFLDCAQPQRLQELADAFAPQDVTAAVATWLAQLLPCFSAAERQQGYRHHLYMAQMEYCHNLLFHKKAALDRLFERLLDHNRGLGHPDKLAVIFGRARFVPDTRTGSTVVKVTRLRTPVIATGLQKTFVKQYVKEGALLRTETTAYQLRELSLPKAIDNLPRVRQVLAGSNDRYLRAQQDVLESYVDRGQLEQLRQPTVSAQGRRTPGLRLDDVRLLAVMQALVQFVHLVGQGCFRTGELLGEVQQALGQAAYRLSQLRYDLGKLRGKGLVVRQRGSQRYEVTRAGYQLAVLYLKLGQRLYGPLTAAVVEPLRSDHRLAPSRRGKADRLYAAVDQALEALTKHWGITTQAAPVQQDGQSANRI